MKKEEVRISLRQVRVIDAVSKTRGIEHAAGMLNMSQSVVSREIASAETLLGISLFQRGWSGTEPTALGERILQRCSAALKLMAKAEDDIETLSGKRPRLKTALRWHHLDAVAAVVQLGSASLASAHLGMTQPAISRSIAAISEYARQPLFVRKRGGLEATSQALRFVALRDELLQELGTIGNLRRGAKHKLIGRLAVGMLPFSGQDFVAKALGDLTNRHPELRLMAIPGSYNTLAAALRRGEIDCMIGILRSPPPFHDLREVFLYNEKFTLVAREEHPCHTHRRSISALRNAKWIVAPHGTPVRAYFEGLFQTEGATPPAQTCEILSFSDAEKVIMNSNAIGLLSYSDQCLANLPPKLKKVDISLPASEIPIGLTIKKSSGAIKILKAFESILRNYCS
jgi:LysR family transcriptional regulator, regulator for genes of the gallate degradation pathway